MMMMAATPLLTTTRTRAFGSAPAAPRNTRAILPLYQQSECVDFHASFPVIKRNQRYPTLILEVQPSQSPAALKAFQTAFERMKQKGTTTRGRETSTISRTAAAPPAAATPPTADAATAAAAALFLSKMSLSSTASIPGRAGTTKAAALERLNAMSVSSNKRKEQRRRNKYQPVSAMQNATFGKSKSSLSLGRLSLGGGRTHSSGRLLSSPSMKRVRSSGVFLS